MKDRTASSHPVKTLPLLATSSMQVEESSLVHNSMHITTGTTTDSHHLLSSDLSSKLMGDVVVACGVTFGVAPFMAVIDKAIVQRAAGTHTVLQSAAQSVTTMVRSPISYVKSPMFLMMWGVYAATYSTANCLKTIVEHQEYFNSESSSTPSSSSSSSGGSKFAVFATTTAVNSSSTMLKDRFYARSFGASLSVASKVPLITYGLWGLRDCMVIGSSFILPEMICGTLEEHTSLDSASALRISQFTCPIATQTLAGPVQLLGLDIYNRPLSHMSWREMVRERFQFQCANFTSIVGARIARIAPAYGLGGVCNTHFRDQWRESLL